MADMIDQVPTILTETQRNKVASEVLALTAIVRPILRGTLLAIKEEAARDAGGKEKLLLRQLARIYRQGDGDCGVCFEYAVHDAILRHDSHVLDRVDTALKRYCKIRGGDPASILFGVEKTGAIQLIKTAKEILTDNSRLLAGVRGQPAKLKRHLDSAAAAFRRQNSTQLPWSISGIWKADLFIGRRLPDQWVGTTVKINQDHLEAARGLRVGIVPCRQGRTDNVQKDDRKNLIVCPLPHDGAFMEIFYQGWAIVQHFLRADAYVPKEVMLPRAADRQVCRYLEERRDFAVVDVIEALEPLAQPELLDANQDAEVTLRRGDDSDTGAIIAPIASFVSA